MGGRGAWRIGGYVADELIGYGASSQVWRGHVARTAEPVALKVLDLADGSAVRAAKAEAALLSALDHPNLVRLRELVPDGESIVLVLELAAGGSLAQLLERRGRLSPGEVVAALSPVAAALAYAHDAGVVHSDVSPANVLFRSNGSSLLADLGVARLLGGFDAPRSTLAYVDPGVAAGAVPSEASDVFMVAATALHALTGSPPWSGDMVEAVLDHAVTGEIDGLDARLAGLPEALVDVVRRGLDPSPVVRGTAAEFALDLRHAAPPVPVDLGVGPARPVLRQPGGAVAMATDAASARAQLRSRLTSSARRSDDSVSGVYAPVPEPGVVAATPAHGPRRRAVWVVAAAGRLLARRGEADGTGADMASARAARARAGRARAGSVNAGRARSGRARVNPARASHAMPDQAVAEAAVARSDRAGSAGAHLAPAVHVVSGPTAAAAAANAVPRWVHVPRHAAAIARPAPGPSGSSRSTTGGSRSLGSAPPGWSSPGAQTDVGLDRPDFARPDPVRSAQTAPDRAEPASDDAPLALTHIVRSRVRPVEPAAERRWRVLRPHRSSRALLAIVIVSALAGATAAWFRWQPSWPLHQPAAARARPGPSLTGTAAGSARPSTAPPRTPSPSSPSSGTSSPNTSAPNTSSPNTSSPNTSAPRAGPTPSDTAWPTTDAGWAAVLVSLDLTRQRAFAAADPVPLSGVYSDVALLRQDEATLHDVVPPGCRLIGLHTVYRGVHASSLTAQQVVLSAQASLAPARLLCPHRSPQDMAGHVPVAMTIVLQRVRGQFLIASIQVPT